MPLSKASGEAVVLHAFDVGNEVSLGKIEKIYNRQPKESQLPLQRLTPDYMKYAEPPLLVSLGSRAFKLKEKDGKGGEKEREAAAKVSVKIYALGVVTVLFRFPVSGDWSEWKAFSLTLADNQKALHVEAEKIVSKLTAELKDAVVAPNDKPMSAHYSIFHVQQTEKPVSSEEWLAKHPDELLAVLFADSKPLSPEHKEALLSNRLSYYSDDLLVISWNAAFLQDAESDFAVLDVLEYAVIESLELRYYDKLLDRELEKAYADVENSRKVGILYDYEKARDEVAEIRIGVNEIIEKVENTLKLVGDVYLARVNRLAAKVLHLAEWNHGVQSKLASLEDVYEFLNDKAHTRRDYAISLLLIVLEVIVTILIALEFIIPAGALKLFG